MLVRYHRKLFLSPCCPHPCSCEHHDLIFVQNMCLLLLYTFAFIENLFYHPDLEAIETTCLWPTFRKHDLATFPMHSEGAQKSRLGAGINFFSWSPIYFLYSQIIWLDYLAGFLARYLAGHLGTSGQISSRTSGGQPAYPDRYPTEYPTGS